MSLCKMLWLLFEIMLIERAAGWQVGVLVSSTAPSPTRLPSAIAMAASLQSPPPIAGGASAAAAAIAVPPEHARFFAALELAVADRRRVDELVTLFEYNAHVTAAGERFIGQGAVKRFFDQYLLEHAFDEIEAVGGGAAEGDLDEIEALPLAEGALAEGAHDPSELILRLRGQGKQCELRLLAQYSSEGGLLHSLVVSEESCSSLSAIAAAARGETEGDGPKWETFDGRVRQRIWQHSDLFAEGNGFLKETLGVFLLSHSHPFVPYVTLQFFPRSHRMYFLRAASLSLTHLSPQTSHSHSSLDLTGVLF